MPKSKIAKIAQEIINENPGIFKALEEFEKTGKLIAKKRMNFTVDREIARKFREHCKKNKSNMSELVENMMRKAS